MKHDRVDPCISHSAARVLAVTPDPRERAWLEAVFSRSAWELTVVSTLCAAKEHLRRSPTAVVLCADELPDGCWKDLFRAAASAEPPRVIVISRMADERLWSEVLDRGGYDLQSIPLSQSELFRMVSLARYSWISSLAAHSQPVYRQAAH